MRLRILALLLLATSALCADELSYLNEPCNPYYPGLGHAKLVTPQWVGETGVEAVVILSIDDMRDTGKYEAYLRPIIDRLKEIDAAGQGPVSIFTNSLDPDDPQLQSWLKEGVSLETHTADHPCPLLCDGDLAKAKSTYDRCVDQLARVPHSQPVAFRMPCCDSLNTPSPRFWTEIFAKQTVAENYLAIDSSVFNVFTAKDPALDDVTTRTSNGASRFRHYLPFPSFVNTIEDYPYPYVIDNLCWEFPCVVPSDWEAQHVQQPNNPKTVTDWLHALDATVAKQGVMPIVFHPHGWIRNEQVVEFIDAANKKYGKRVKFLSFADCLKRINEHLLAGEALRQSAGNVNDARLIDINHDGFMDVLRRDGEGTLTRIWNPKTKRFRDHRQSLAFAQPRFAKQNGKLHLLLKAGLATESQGYVWDGSSSGNRWQPVELPKAVAAANLLRDIDGDGTSEVFTSAVGATNVQRWSSAEHQFTLPVDLNVPPEADPGLRFVDLNNDSLDDVVFSNGKQYRVLLFRDWQNGWEEVQAGNATDPQAIPAIAARDGTNNGAWMHSQYLWVQNEATHRMPDLVDRVSFAELVKGKKRIPSTDSVDKTADGETVTQTDKAAVLGAAKSLVESLATFSTLPGATLQVVAAEPQIADPVAFDWGPNGELWVVEMGDYPNGANWHEPGDKKNDPGGRVKLLLDQDGDGRYETAHTFLDQLAVPTGVKAYRDGVLLTVAPDILYAVDTDGDHIADQTKVLYTGLTPGNHQHRANGLRWGLDQWLHIANGDSGGELLSTKTQQRVSIRGADVKIHPDSGGMKLISGQTQYGRSRDNQGNWFGGNNSNPVWHYVLDAEFLARNPHVSPPSSRKQIAAEPGAAPVFPTSETVERFNDFDRANRFTSACSTEISRNDADDQQFVYVCEPVHNLVHRSVLTRDGLSFTSARAASERETEFLTSSDNWFRPVMVRAGPDNAIWVADMYRQVIEHPEWIPMEWQNRLDHLAGNDKGRIYRLVFDAQKPDPTWRKLGGLDGPSLVAKLDSPNGVLRDMVQQRLYEKKPAGSIERLKQLSNKSRWPLAKIPAMRLLNELDALDGATLVAAFDKDRVSRHVLRLAAQRFSQSTELRDAFHGWFTKQKSLPKQLCLELAYAMHDFPDARKVTVLGRLALQNEDDPYCLAAVMSSVKAEDVPKLMDLFCADDALRKTQPSPTHVVAQLLSSAIGYGSNDGVKRFVAGLDELSQKPQSKTAAIGWLSEFHQVARKHNKSVPELLGQESKSSLMRPGVGSLGAFTLELAQDTTASEADRMNAIRLFDVFPDSADQKIQILNSLVGAQSSAALQVEAIRRLRLIGKADTKIALNLYGKWSALTPSVRRQLVQQTLTQEQWMNVLLAKMEAKEIAPRQIDLQFQRRIREHNWPEVRSRADVLFEEVTSDRAALVEKFASTLRGRPDLTESESHRLGKQVFEKRCSVCHQLEGVGKVVGPDLTALTDKSQPAMLAAILDPNRAVEDKYLDYVVQRKDGTSLQGMLLDETATSVKLASATGEEHTVLRGQIETLHTTDKSLMPEGLEQLMERDELAAVIGYVQSVKANRKRFDGNAPQVAPVRDDRSIRLFAMHAEVYGPNLVFESKYRNLGFWHSDQDRAVWTIDAPKAGKYSVNFDFACAPQAKKNRFQLSVNGQKLAGELGSTGSWDQYDSKGVGDIWLPDEPVQVTITSEGPVEGFLFDLRTVVLWPEE